MTSGCYICDPAAFFSDEEPCMECFMRWHAYATRPTQETDPE